MGGKGMHEHITRALYYFEVHLLFASIVWCAAWVLTSIRQGSATMKYWIWVAALLNFIQAASQRSTTLPCAPYQHSAMAGAIVNGQLRPAITAEDRVLRPAPRG